MAEVEVKLPPLGEDAPDNATVSYFVVQEGDEIKEGEDLCEMVTDKATFMVPAPCSGRVKKIVAKEDDVIRVGELLATVETGE